MPTLHLNWTTEPCGDSFRATAKAGMFHLSAYSTSNYVVRLKDDRGLLLARENAGGGLIDAQVSAEVEVRHRALAVLALFPADAP